VASLVREYGFLYESAVELAEELRPAPSVRELRELSRCLFASAAEAAQEFAQQADQRQRELDLKHFGFIAHELRTPLGAALLSWHHIRKNERCTSPHANILNRSLERLTKLVDDTLSSARLASLGQVPAVHVESVDVASLLAEAEAESRAEAEVKDVTIVVAPQSGLKLRGDPRLLLSALTNFVRNAVKFTHIGGTVVLRSRIREQRIVIEVQDQCGGLRPDRAERLFEAFKRANQNRTGFGLGLAIAKQAIEAHGGTVGVKNVPDSGCIFEMELSQPD
jgi:signal transduction histidine kinase